MLCYTYNKKDDAFTLIELIISMFLMSLIFLLINTILGSSIRIWERGERRTDHMIEGRAAIFQLKKDLSGVYPNRYGSGIRVSRIKNDDNKFVENQIDGRIILPFEINRTNGLILNQETESSEGEAKSSNQKKALINSDDNYDTFGFVSLSPKSHGFEDPSLCAYYVAYTRNSPLKNSSYSMKLFRHFRNSQDSKNTLNTINNYINSIYSLEKYGEIKDKLPSLLNGNFQNKDIPYLFYTKHPVPVNKSDFSSNNNHNDNFEVEDECVAYNVVRFKVRALKLVDNNNLKILKSKEVNKLLNINDNEEWPVLIRPDYLDISISVIDDRTAKFLDNINDWIIDWNSNTNKNDFKRKLIEKNQKTFSLRIAIN